MIQRMGFKGCRDHYRRTCLDRHLRPKKRICVAVRYLLVALAIPFGTYYVIARHPQSCWFTCNFDDGWECHNGISCSCGIARLSNSTCCPFALRLPHITLMHQSLYLCNSAECKHFAPELKVPRTLTTLHAAEPKAVTN